MQNPFDSLRHLAEQLNWVNQMISPEMMAQVREGAPSLKETGERPRAPRPPLPAQGGGPPIEIYVTAEAVVLCAALPGLTSPEQVWVSLLGPREVLLEAYLPPYTAGGALLHQERFTGYCHRIVTLPATIRPEPPATSYIDGMLQCRFPRLAQDGESPGVAVLQVNQP